jgi:hypothetical protein
VKNSNAMPAPSALTFRVWSLAAQTPAKECTMHVIPATSHHEVVQGQVNFYNQLYGEWGENASVVCVSMQCENYIVLPSWRCSSVLSSNSLGAFALLREKRDARVQTNLHNSAVSLVIMVVITAALAWRWFVGDEQVDARKNKRVLSAPRVTLEEWSWTHHVVVG